MSRVVIIGCGIVGAAIAYELSQVPGLYIRVLDKQPPAQGSTGAALGVLMGIISHKIKGKAWQMRQDSIQRYETLIPELETFTGRKIPFNQQGILKLCFAGEDLEKWQKLVEIRHSQNFQLEIWDTAQVKSRCPHLDTQRIKAAVYSPQDRQVDPVALTLALVEAAQLNGVTFDFGRTIEESNTFKGTGKSQQGTVTGLEENCYLSQPHFPLKGEALNPGNREQEKTVARSLFPVPFLVDISSLLQDTDWLVIAAGLGSFQITASLQNPVDIRPVLGQALHLQLRHPLGHINFQPVITGDDVHIVPLGTGEYWVGATVEFATDGDKMVATPDNLEKVRQEAIAFCPALAEATVIKTWSGLRPRPEGRPAPIIGHLPGYNNVLLATGHYRNGVLLAPATAQAIREIIVGV